VRPALSFPPVSLRAVRASLPPASVNDRREEAPVESILIELRAAEGGDDAKALVNEMLVTYLKAGPRNGL